jgi:hypothetical protein
MKKMSNPVNIASHRATSQTEAEVIYTTLTESKLPLKIVCLTSPCYKSRLSCEKLDFTQLVCLLSSHLLLKSEIEVKTNLD